MQIAFRQLVLLNAVNGAVHFPRGLPILAERVCPVPVVLPLLSQPEVFAGFSFIGRSIRNLVIGPFGVAIIGELPNPKNLRRHGNSWEFRRADGRWVAFENPLEKAARDADRIRHWLGGEDRDFIVKVYPAVVVEDDQFSRTPACAAITSDQIPAWLAALPAQRSLSPDRQADIAERIRSIA